LELLQSDLLEPPGGSSIIHESPQDFLSSIFFFTISSASLRFIIVFVKILHRILTLRQPTGKMLKSDMKPHILEFATAEDHHSIVFSPNLHRPFAEPHRPFAVSPSTFRRTSIDLSPNLHRPFAVSPSTFRRTSGLFSTDYCTIAFRYSLNY
jgi:hypothetical protein